jgi:hypothetical protein
LCGATRNEAHRFQGLQQLTILRLPVLDADSELRPVADRSVEERIVVALQKMNPEECATAPETGWIRPRFRPDELN